MVSLIRKSIMQVKRHFPLLVTTYTVLLFMLVTVSIIGNHYHIPIGHLTRDPSVILHGSPFIGVISSIGILFWCSTVALCFFCSVICFNDKRISHFRFLLFSGLFTAFLMFDDLFTFHEIVFPDYLHVPEKIVYLVYITVFLIYSACFCKRILDSEYAILLIACVFFSLSLIIDQFFEIEGMGYLLEDGFKLFGIVTWFLFFLKTCHSTLNKSIEPKVTQLNTGQCGPLT